MRKLKNLAKRGASRMQSYWVLLLVLLAGVFFLWVSTEIIGDAGDIIQDIGKSLIGAFALGLTLDIAFRTQIAKDVFQEAFGYFLSPKIREETRWITSLERIATHTLHEFTLNPHPSNTGKIILEESVTREIENLTNKCIKFTPLVGIQEWFHQRETSKIISFTYLHLKNNEEIGSGSLSGGEVLEHETLEDGYLHHAEAKELDVYPGEKVTVRWGARQIKYKSDSTYTHTNTALLSPRILVKTHPDLDLNHKVKFMSRHQPKLLDLGDGEYVLPGLLLPSQAVRVRWWDPIAKEEWETWRNDQKEAKQKQIKESS